MHAIHQKTRAQERAVDNHPNSLARPVYCNERTAMTRGANLGVFVELFVHFIAADVLQGRPIREQRLHESRAKDVKNWATESFAIGPACHKFVSNGNTQCHVHSPADSLAKARDAR